MKLDFNKVVNKLSDNLKDSNWFPILGKFIDSQSFYKLLETMENLVDNGRRFTPELKYWFRAFQECNYNDVKVVIIGQDPYPNLAVADGIAFSSSRQEQIPSSLSYIFDAIEQEYGKVNKDPDLTRWANQGVLLLNCALTTEVNKIGAHYSLWEKFIAYVVHTLDREDRDILFIFLGQKAMQYAKYVKKNHWIMRHHPNVGRYRKKWDSNNLFGAINDWLESKELVPISWN